MYKHKEKLQSNTNTNSDDVKTCISIIKGEIPFKERNVDNYPILKKARFYEEK